MLAPQHGIYAGTETNIVSAYADDIILYLKDPHKDHAPLSVIFEKFQLLSGLSINETKSYGYSFRHHRSQDSIHFGQWTFQLAQTTFKYLGIHIYRELDNLTDGNVTRAINAIRAQIKFWTSLPVSVAGRVAITKMVLLPRLLHFFTNLPIVFPAHIFKALDTLLIELIWGTGRRRIGLAKLKLIEAEDWGYRTSKPTVTPASFSGWHTGWQAGIYVK